MSAARWDPELYLAHAGPRTRPAAELLARVEVPEPASVVDLGCGTGTSTALLRRRWPHAHVLGVDRSPEMIETARNSDVDARWQLADIASWQPDGPVDVVYSNAALQWLDHHDRLLPALVATLRPGGALAVQMPLNHEEPSHRLVAEVVSDGPWGPVLEGVRGLRRVADPAWYHGLLRPRVSGLDLWETVYHHELTGDRPVLEWLRGTTLRPFLTALAAEAPQLVEAFEDTLGARLADAYPPDDGGRTRFPFRRLFLVAVR